MYGISIYMLQAQAQAQAQAHTGRLSRVKHFPFLSSFFSNNKQSPVVVVPARCQYCRVLPRLLPLSSLLFLCLFRNLDGLENGAQPSRHRRCATAAYTCVYSKYCVQHHLAYTTVYNTVLSRTPDDSSTFAPMCSNCSTVHSPYTPILRIDGD